MNKKYVFYILTSAVILGLVGFLFLSTSESSTSTQPTDSSKSSENSQPEVTGQTQPPAPTGTGKYIDYSDDAIAEGEGERVLFFHAPWCPQCVNIEKDIESQGVPDGFTIIKVDYDSNQALRQKYGVTLQTTFVKVNENGEFISKYVAYNEPTLAALQRDYL